MSDALSGWAARFAAGLDALRRPMDYITAPPPDVIGTDPTDVLKQLLGVRTSLSVTSERNYALEAGQALAASVYSTHHKADFEERVAQIVTTIDRQLAGVLPKLTSEALTSAGLVRTSDFGDIRRLVFPDLPEAAPLSGHAEALLLIAGSLDSLSADHPLRTLVPAALPDGLYEVDRQIEPPLPGRAMLLLGRPVPSLGAAGPAQPFYVLADCYRWTRWLRVKQLEKIEEEARKRRAEKQKELEEFWASEAGRLKLAAIRLQKLEDAGKVPALLEEAPAVRIGGR